MALPNVGLCNTCSARVPAQFIKKDGQVWILKECPQHGTNESLVSGDSEAWQAKRDLFQYVPADPTVCTLKCDKCHFNHKPNMLFLDVTNHCNMHCPICIASIRRMGFDYNPPLAYFEKIFAHAAKWDPKPVVQLFGGEPTCRNDLFEIIDLAKKYGLRCNVTTNGVRLGNEAYAKKFCEARIGMRFAFDGFGAEIYEKLRHNRPAYFHKVKGLENLKKYSRRKQSIISCFARGVNDDKIAELVQYCHDNSDWVSDLLMIPLAETWDPKVFKEAKPCTMEDLEKMVKDSIPGGGVEFVPAGISYAARLPRKFIYRNPRSEMLLLAGVHPNCESLTLLISDGKQYRGINHFLKVPFSQMMREFAELCKKMEPTLSRLDADKFFQRMRGKLLVLRTLGPWLFRVANFKALGHGHPILEAFKALGSSLAYKLSRRRKDAGEGFTRRRRRVLRLAMLPFEEQHSVDATRLENCKNVFAYEDEKGEIQTIPTCMWPPYRDVVLRTVSRKYGAVDQNGKLRTPEQAMDPNQPPEDPAVTDNLAANLPVTEAAGPAGR